MCTNTCAHATIQLKKRRHKSRGKLAMLPLHHTKENCWKLFAVSFRLLLCKGRLSFQFAFKAQRLFYSVCFISFWEKANVIQFSISRKWHCSVFSSSWWPPSQTFPVCRIWSSSQSGCITPPTPSQRCLSRSSTWVLVCHSWMHCSAPMKRGACLHSRLWFSPRIYLAWLLTCLIIPLDI